MYFQAYIYAMRSDILNGKHKIYFIGIGGVSMSGLALFLKRRGFSVSGSDISANEYTAGLEKEGIKVYFDRECLNAGEADAVIYNSAISETNGELTSARRYGIPTYGRAELLSYVADCFENVIGIAGCHGKTTAAAMCVHVLQACSDSCSAHIGGADLDYGNFHLGGERYFVTEACEYKENFLKLHPDLAVVLNTDKDHLECYGNEEKLFSAYVEYASSAPAAVVCGEDKLANQLPFALTFGIGKENDISAANVRSSGGCYSFTLRIFGKLFDRVRLNVYGRHNVYNALAAAAVAQFYGYPSSFIADGLRKFRGVRRRFEWMGKLYGAEIIADYAHHPNEIAASIRTAMEISKGKLFVIFQPHTYSRTRLLFDEFLAVLGKVGNLVIYKTYPAREYFDDAGSAYTLSKSLPNALYIESVREMDIYLNCSLSSGDVVLFLGAGDIYYVAEQLLRRKKISD